MCNDQTILASPLGSSHVLYIYLQSIVCAYEDIKEHCCEQFHIGIYCIQKGKYASSRRERLMLLRNDKYLSETINIEIRYGANCKRRTTEIRIFFVGNSWKRCCSVQQPQGGNICVCVHCYSL